MSFKFHYLRIVRVIKINNTKKQNLKVTRIKSNKLLLRIIFLIIKVYLREYLVVPIKSDFSINVQCKHGNQGMSLENWLINRSKYQIQFGLIQLFKLIFVNWNILRAYKTLH